MKELQEKENYYQSLIQDKEKDIEQLQLQVELASKHSMDEVNETRVKIEESLKELEAHKQKRLAARNEMIQLAKVRHLFLWLVDCVFLLVFSVFLLLLRILLYLGFGKSRI
jgi:ppGpp synthetase/RelA/SpoT-type nucleotidyltranferase